jgi:hypothetical protein
MARRDGRRGGEADDQPIQNCPKCGAPRLGHAWDCGECGHLFDPAVPAQLRELEPASVQSPAPAVESARRPSATPPAGPGSSARRPTGREASSAAAPTRHTGLRRWVDDNLGVAITLAVLAYLGVYAVLSTQLVASTNDRTAIVNQYRAVVGESPPVAFQPILGLNLVGRRLQIFANPENGQLLLLYHEGWLAGRADAGRLSALPDKALGFLDLPYKNLGSRRARMLHLPVDLRAVEVELAPETSMRGYVAMFTGNTRRPAVLCLAGEPKATLETARTMFREQ